MTKRISVATDIQKGKVHEDAFPEDIQSLIGIIPQMSEEKLDAERRKDIVCG